MEMEKKQIKKNIKRVEKLRQEALALRVKLKSVENEIDILVRETPLP